MVICYHNSILSLYNFVLGIFVMVTCCHGDFVVCTCFHGDLLSYLHVGLVTNSVILCDLGTPQEVRNRGKKQQSRH